MTKRSERLNVALPPLVLLAVVQCCLFWALPAPAPEPICLEAPYLPPPAGFQDSDLAGTWQTQYGRSVDTLTLSADGTFKQVYQDPTAGDYVYESPSKEWTVERFPDGRVWLHLPGARYYLGGIKMAERDGLQAAPYPGFWGTSGPPPSSFYDPIADEHLEMVAKIVLNVRIDSSGELVLMHMWSHHDRGFPMAGCQSEQFRRVETP